MTDYHISAVSKFYRDRADHSGHRSIKIPRDEEIELIRAHGVLPSQADMGYDLPRSEMQRLIYRDNN